jgi:hypothetical protein
LPNTGPLRGRGASEAVHSTGNGTGQ